MNGGAVILTAALAAACRESTARRPARDGAAARRLVGAWDVRLTLTDSAMALTPAFAPTPRARTARGQLALVASDTNGGSADAADVPALDGPPTHYGTYALDLTPFGVDVRPGVASTAVPVLVLRERAAARAAGEPAVGNAGLAGARPVSASAPPATPDTVVLVLSPGPDGTGVVLRGVYSGADAGDSIAGGWRLSGAGRAPTSAAGGRFVMHRATPGRVNPERAGAGTRS